ncbi:MAG: ABC transporter permease [Dongiaceae bacterium]
MAGGGPGRRPARQEKADLPPRWGLLPLLPALAILLALYAGPLVLMLLYSFWRVKNFRMVPDWTLDNYAAFLSNPAYLRVFARTVEMAAITTILALVIAYPLAWFIAKVARRSKLLLVLLIVIPFWTSFVIRAYAWATILGARGLVNSLLIWLGLVDDPVQALLYSPTSVVIGLLSIYLPFMVLSIYASLERLDDRLIEAARDLYAGTARTWCAVILPLTLPGAVVGALFVFIPILGEYVVPSLLGGVSGFFITNVIVQLFGQSGQWGQGSAIAFTMLAFILLTLWLLRRFVRTDALFAR